MADRIRTLKPDIWEDEDFGRLEPFEQLVVIGMITKADDEGRLKGEPALLMAKLWPYQTVDAEDIDDALAAAEGVGLILRYMVNDRPYIVFPKWKKHQRINRPSPSPLPPPPEQTALAVDAPNDRSLEHTAILQALETVAEHTGGKLNADAIPALLREFPDKDHLSVARDYAYWQVHGGPRRPHKDVTAGYRNQLKRAPDVVKAQGTSLVDGGGEFLDD